MSRSGNGTSLKNPDLQKVSSIHKGKRDGVLRILQITDCHLNRDTQADLLGVKTLESLDAVLAKVKQDQRNPDMVLLTGDLAQDGSVEAYRLLEDRLSGFSCPQYWFAGNHDVRSNMESVANSDNRLDKVVDFGPWRLILLDSLVEGSVHGRLEDTELSLLESALKDTDDKHIMVALHHHPVDIDCRWLDGIGLHNSEAFWSHIEPSPSVRAVLWGHIHQEFNAERDGVQLMASPSTCIQFLPKSDDFAIDNIAPGYRWLELHDDGTIKSEVCRADDYQFEVDMTSNGY